VLTDHTFDMGLALMGNRELKPGCKTNPLFVFETPVETLAHFRVPVVENHAEWNIASAPNTIAVHIQSMFEEVFRGANSELLKAGIDCIYRYQISDGMDLTTDVPIFKIPMMDVSVDWNSTDTKDLILQLTNSIQLWQQSQGIPGINGKYIFDIKIYTAEREQEPILQFSNLTLKIAEITDLSNPVRG
jgi:hypothetical protein